MVDKIVLYHFGGYVLLLPNKGDGILNDFWVFLACPSTHIPMAAIWVALYCTVASPFSFNLFRGLALGDLNTIKGFFSYLFQQSIFQNAALLAFNVIVPAYPLDGGRCLAALLVKCGVQVLPARIITIMTAVVSVCVAGIYGLSSAGGVRDTILIFYVRVFIGMGA
jgi:Zn-dependent protease